MIIEEHGEGSIKVFVKTLVSITNFLVKSDLEYLEWYPDWGTNCNNLDSFPGAGSKKGRGFGENVHTNFIAAEKQQPYINEKLTLY